jgi:gas vesicle protein
MHRGYVKLWRKIEDWAWYNELPTKHLFQHLLIKANHKPTHYKKYDVPRGSCVVGLKALSKHLGLTIQQVRTAILNLISTCDIAKKSTNQFSIVNYELYQSTETIPQQTSNKRTTTSKECKNEKNKAFASQLTERATPKGMVPHITEVSRKVTRYVPEATQEDSQAADFERKKFFDFTKSLRVSR